MRKPVAYATLGVAVLTVGAVAVWFAAFRNAPLPIDEVLAVYEEDRRYGGLTIDYPLDQTLFPPEIPPPRFRWRDETDSDTWLVTIRFQDEGEPLSCVADDAQWIPSESLWDEVKRRSREKEAGVTVLGVRRREPREILSAARTSIGTSADEVGAPLFYREVHLPFAEAVADTAAHIRWRFGDVSCRERPPIVLEKLPVCGNCHSFSRDGTLMGMDVDYANGKGSYVICPVSQEIALDDSKIITWGDYQPDDGEGTFGLLSQVSPDGRYVASTVKDFSVFVPRDDLAFSQLFFPIKGVVGVYDRQTGEFRALPGADDKRFVQSNPVWSPDGRFLVFARTTVYRAKKKRRQASVVLDPADYAEFLEGGKTFQYDLYRIPFNDGRGGTPEPLAGASQNGLSNYFPRYSPDGKWIVFCRAKSFMLLQPDSELYIIPAEGGAARRLRCNGGRMNSWHSWSPNGRWLVFSSKANSPYTQLMLTHVDAEGRTSPPVELDRFTTSQTAANIPEFVNASADGIKSIRQQFLDAQSYFRSATDALQIGDNEAAERAYRMALAMDPNHLEALHGLGVVLLLADRLQEAEAQFAKAVALDPDYGDAYHGLGSARGRQGKFQEALDPLRRALEIDPDDPNCHLMLGTSLMQLGQLKEGRAHLNQAVRLDERYAESRPLLDRADRFLAAGKLEDATIQYRRVLERTPDYLPALVGLASILATAGDEGLRDGRQAVALADKASRLSGYGDSAALAVLAAAYAETGQFERAVQVADRALQSARRDENKLLANLLESDLPRYRRNEPSRRPIGPWPASDPNPSG